MNRLIIAVVLLALCLPASLTAQSWTELLGGGGEDYARSVQIAPNGDLIVVGFDESNGDNFDVSVKRFTSDGLLRWSTQIDSENLNSNDDLAFNSYQKQNGDILVVGRNEFSTGFTDAYFVLLDQAGNFIWENTLFQDGASSASDAVAAADESVFYFTGSLDGEMQLGTLALDGSLVKDTAIANSIEGNSLVLTASGNVLSGGFNTRDVLGEPINDPALVLFDADLENELDRWQPEIDEVSQAIEDVIQLSDGSFAITGQICRDLISEQTGQPENTCMAFVSKHGSDLEELWIEENIAVTGFEGRGIALAEADNGDILMTGRQDGQVFLARHNPTTGIQMWSLKYDIFGSTGVGCSVQQSPKGFLITGHVDEGNFGQQDGYLMEVNEDGLQYTNQLRGFVFPDYNGDCVADAGIRLSDIVVEFYNDNFRLYTRPDFEGRYEIDLPNGSFQVEIHTASEAWELSPCTRDLVVEADGTIMEIQHLFLTDVYECSDLALELSTGSMNPCSVSTYELQFCNAGTIPSDLTAIEVLMDEELTIVGASTTWSETEAGIAFDIDSLNPADCGRISFDAILSCDADPLRTFIVQAKEVDADFCNPGSTDWDGSDLRLSANCSADSIYILIQNVGDDMTDVARYRIVEDNVLGIVFPIELEEGELVEIVRPLTGQTIRVDVEQSEGHPSNGFPSVTLEACVPQGQEDYSTGFVTDFPQDDNDLFVDIDCFELSDQLDSFDEISYPAGVGEEHLIERDQSIEYKIVYQNLTGEKINRLEIRQHFSPHLDITSLSYSLVAQEEEIEVDYRIVEDNVLGWVWQDTLGIAEQVFVKFTIDLLPGLPAGTLIENETEVYEDFAVPYSRTTNRFLRIADPLLDDTSLEKSVEWDFFTVETNNQQNYLSWQTIAEYNNDRFSLMHSMNGGEFTEFLSLSVDPESAGELRDAVHSPGPGDHCYRIDQYNIYGAVQSTREVCVTIDAIGNEWSMQGSHPVEDLLELLVLTTGESEETLRIYQTDGKLVYEIPVELQQGFNEVKINLADLSRGVYVLEMSSLQEHLSMKMVKQ